MGIRTTAKTSSKGTMRTRMTTMSWKVKMKGKITSKEVKGDQKMTTLGGLTRAGVAKATSRIPLSTRI